MLKKLIREPLLHFLLIGAVLFGVYTLVNPDALQSDKQIVVDQGQINSLTQRFKRVWQREPTETELQGLIEDFVIEEIYYREALAMGIDKNDPVIRRRLRQKMELYTDNLATTLAPSDAQLNDYLQQYADKFKTDARYSFEQVYINTDRPADKLNEQVSSVEAALRKGHRVQGDPFLLPARFENADAFAIDRSFGKEFAAKLDTLALNTWSPPLHSGLGIHFVKLTARQAGQLPALADIRDKVEREWRFDKAKAIDRTLRQKLLANYDVTVINRDNSNKQP